MSEKILLVDDEAGIIDLISLYLTNECYEIFAFTSAHEAMQCIKTEKIDLAILDIMLPDMNGLDMCKEIRKYFNFPIIMLTARNQEIDKIKGLTLGADDYITKPFLPLELVARVKAQLRRYKRYGNEQEEDGIIVHNGLVLNVKTHECILNEKPIILTPTEFSILHILCKNIGYVVSSIKYGEMNITAKAIIPSLSIFGICVKKWVTPLKNLNI